MFNCLAPTAWPQSVSKAPPIPITIDIVDADELLASSMEKMISKTSFLSAKCCIFQVPNKLRRHDAKAYVPNAFSFGPLHHGKPHPKEGEKFKWQYLDRLISRAPTSDTSLKNFIKSIRELEGEARQCYAVPIDDQFNEDEFVKILVLDGCFIIELLRLAAREFTPDAFDPLLGITCMPEFLSHDLILLENQVPWLVLDCLFSMTNAPDGKSLLELALLFLVKATIRTPLNIVDTKLECKHLLDLLRNAFVLPSTAKNNACDWETLQVIPSATSLEEKGIRFKKGTSRSILDIKFSNGVREIPPLMIHEITSDAFRNLIGLEQCYSGCTTMVTSYAKLLNNLIRTTNDIKVLRQHGIINNWLVPEEAIKFWRKLYHDASIVEFYYVELCDQVNQYCQRSWPRWRATYVRNHFGSPWAIFSQVIAGMILVLTFLQTFYTIKK